MDNYENERMEMKMKMNVHLASLSGKAPRPPPPTHAHDAQLDLRVVKYICSYRAMRKVRRFHLAAQFLRTCDQPTTG